MALSVRGIAGSCLGVSGAFSVRRDVYGYVWGPMNRTLRLQSHLELISGQAINLSLILVAHEPDFSGQFDQADTQRMQAAVDRVRELYAQVNLGVRRLYWQYIPVADANGYATVDADEATELTEDWSGDNDGIDVFWVSNVTDAGGWSNSDGPCDKNENKERTGVVLELQGSDNFTGILLADEVGHYLGLEHANTITNLMGVDSNNDGIGELDGTSTNITNAQGNTMRSGCWVRSPC
jgi:hypothetical protein